MASNAGRLETKEWPFDEAVKPDDRCEARFYIGQWHLLKGNRSEAEVGLKAAVATCPNDFPASIAAIAELKRLKP